MPRQVRRVSTVMVGLTNTTANRRQNPILRRATAPSSPAVPARTPPSPATTESCLLRRPARTLDQRHDQDRRYGWQDGRVLPASWVLIVPVKRLAAAKSRLRGAVPGVPHERLVLALAQDTVAAAVGRVPRCSSSRPIRPPRRALAALGARVVPDRPDAGLNAALAYGASLAAAPGRRLGRR